MVKTHGKGEKRKDGTTVKVTKLFAARGYTDFFFQSNKNTPHRAENI